MKHQGQAALEFLILIGFLLLSFTIFFLLIQENQQEKTTKKIDAELQEIARTIRTEITLAEQSSNGYQRTFTLPTTIHSGSYNINLTSELVFVSTTNKERTISLAVKNTTGTINPGTNTIKKQNETITINE